MVEHRARTRSASVPRPWEDTIDDPGSAPAEAVRARNEAWLAAAERCDLDGMMSIYAPDAEELLPGLAPLVGREAIRAFYASLLERFPSFRHEFAPTGLLVARSADLVVARGAYRFTPDVADPEGTQTGKYVGVWQRADDGWLLRYNISNADPASG